MHDLDNNYTLWMHMLYDNDWSINSYKKIYNFNTIEKAACLIENLNSEIIEKTMIFLMKNDIKPIWEVEENKRGGCFSYKIKTCYIYELWKKMSYMLIGNSMIDDNIIVKNKEPSTSSNTMKLSFDDFNDFDNDEVVEKPKQVSYTFSMDEDF